MDRRRFLTLSAATAAYTALPLRAQTTPPSTTPGNLNFIFFTDTHLQPELSAAQGTAKAMAKIKSLKPTFCIQGGDHVMDMTLVPRDRSAHAPRSLSKNRAGPRRHPRLPHHRQPRHLRPRAQIRRRHHRPPLRQAGLRAALQHQNLPLLRREGLPLHHPRLHRHHPQARVRRRHRFCPARLAQADLAATPAGTPIIVVSHVPIVSAAPQYSPATDKAAQAVAYQALTNLHAFLLGNPYDVLTLFEGHNVIAVLQGHTHINETVYWRNIPFITSGAVCGNWWNGSRWGTPEGFTAIELDRGAIHWHYETYGWHSAAPIPDPLAPIPHPRTQPLPRPQPDLS